MESKLHDLYLDRDRQHESMLDETGRDLTVAMIGLVIGGVEESIKALENYKAKLKAQASELRSQE